jgi:hypothetical protein
VRHDGEFVEPEPSMDDLTALAEAVREAGRPDRPPLEPVRAAPAPGGARRGHLRILPDPLGD